MQLRFRFAALRTPVVDALVFIDAALVAGLISWLMPDCCLAGLLFGWLTGIWLLGCLTVARRSQSLADELNKLRAQRSESEKCDCRPPKALPSFHLATLKFLTSEARRRKVPSTSQPPLCLCRLSHSLCHEYTPVAGLGWATDYAADGFSVQVERAAKEHSVLPAPTISSTVHVQ
jgi:hypothetical protein